jgi:hypothetical protein
MNIPLRHRCRNPRCRLKLPAPVENEHHAFCTPGCHASFYRSRCLVCEESMTRKRGRQLFKSGHRVCQSDYRKFPRAYDFPRVPTAQKGSDSPIVNNPLGSAHFTGLKIGLEGERPRHRALRHWSWRSDGVEHELRDADGTRLARLESNGGRHRLTHPATLPVLSWSPLVEAMHRAESVALTSIGLANTRAVKVEPHPMGLTINRQKISQETAIASDWKPTGDGADVPDLPAFLRRSA